MLAVEELHFAKQGSMTSGEFHFHIVKIAKRCKFPNPEAEESNAIFLGMNSQQARDKAINLMNEEAKELTVEFLMSQLAIEDCNTQHKILEASEGPIPADEITWIIVKSLPVPMELGLEANMQPETDSVQEPGKKDPKKKVIHFFYICHRCGHSSQNKPSMFTHAHHCFSVKLVCPRCHK